MQMYSSVSHVAIGAGSSANLTQFLHQLSDRAIRHVLLVSDAQLLSLGLLEGPMAELKDAGIEVTLFTDVLPDPSEAIVLSCTEVARRARVDAVLAIGGGSSMDVAKVVAVLAEPSCSQSIAEIYGVDLVKGDHLPLLLAPTTAGTGSEMTPVAILTTANQLKMGIVSPQLYADVAILDPNLTASLPPSISSVTGIDAMIHAIEAYTSRIKKNPISDQLALSALMLLSNNIEAACQPAPTELVRQNMLVGAMMAGQAFANAPVGAIHALAYPLGGLFHLSHGLSNALVMVQVMEFNLPDCAQLYAELADHLRLSSDPDEGVQAQALITYLKALVLRLNIEPQLRDHGINETDLERLATDAMLQTRLLVNNPRDLTFDDALTIYRAAF